MAAVIDHSNESIKSKVLEAIDKEYSKFYEVHTMGRTFKIAPALDKKPKLKELHFTKGNDLVFCFKDICRYAELDEAIPRIYIDSDGTLNSIVLGDFSPNKMNDYKKYLYTLKDELIDYDGDDKKIKSIEELEVKIQEINLKRIRSLLKSLIKASKNFDLDLLESSKITP